MNSKKINQLATELTPSLSDLTIIGDPSTGISKKITLSQMASLFTGTVEEYANLAAFPLVGTADTIYIALDTNIIYRWNTGTSAYVELSPNIVTSLVFSDANGFDGTISLVGSTATLTITTALTTGSVPFIGASGALSQDNANLFFDDTNNRLGINTNAPTTALDVFGSGIIGRLNGTSTNNAFLGFASAGTNKWSIGNVQSDHRFRIYNEATTSELFTVLQTGEVGVGIANPLTKVHIDGGATALIANLDANVSVAKSISFRSDNSNRINLEVSGTESGSNAGADLFIRRYSDAGALIDTPFSIIRSTGTAIFSGIVSETKTADGIIQTIGGNTTKANIYQFTSGGIAGAVFNIGHNFYYDGTNYGQDNTAKSGWVTSSNLNSDTFSIARAAAGSTSAPTSYLTINSTGNIGINTSTPSSFSGYTNLSLKASGASGVNLDFFNSGGTRQASIVLDSSNAFNFTANANIPLVFGTNDTERMRITSTGIVAIGTTTNLGGGNLEVQTNGVSAYTARSSSTTGANGGTTVVALRSVDSSASYWANAQYNGWEQYFCSGGSTERMRITNGGYLKVSNTGTYYSSGGSYHEILQSATSNSCLRVFATSTSYNDAVQQINCYRANSSSYDMAAFYSNNFADIEFSFRGDGQAYADGSWNGGGADYAEYFEWLDGNPNNEDRRGYSVSLVGNKIKIAQKGETIIGVISGNPSVVGDSAWNIWAEKYLRDDFGTYVRDENGDRILNPNYNPDIEYISREQRPEWGIVGLMGKLCIRKGQEVMPSWVKMKEVSNFVEQWLIK